MHLLNHHTPTPINTELLSLAKGPEVVKSYTACIVNGVRFVTEERDSRRTTQNSGVSTPGEGGSMFYGVLEEILVLTFWLEFKVVLFKCKWFKTVNTGQTIRWVKKNNITSILTKDTWYKDDHHILATQANQIFYLNDPSKTSQFWKVVQEVNHRSLWARDIVENEADVIHGTSSSDTTLDANLESLTYPTLGIPEQSTSAQIDLSRETDFIDDEDEDSDDEDGDGDDEDGDHEDDDSEEDDYEDDDEGEPQMRSNKDYSSDEDD